jgi:hypothetical protein
MNDDSDDYKVGRGRSPRDTRRKKGQSRNPQRTPRKAVETAADMMDRLLVTTVQLTIKDETRKVTTLEAIVLALSQKAFAGNMNAKRALLKYCEFAKTHSERKFQLTFVESEYTRAVSRQSDSNND